MPKIPLNDALGLDANGKLVAESKFSSLLPAFLHLKDVPLNQVPFAESHADLVFDKPIDVGVGGVALQVGALGGGSLSIIGPRQRALDENDTFTIAVNEDERYIALALRFTTTAGASIAAGSATFGFSADSGFSITCYRRFQKAADAFPTFSAAIAEAFGSFLLPKSPAELDTIDASTVLVIEGSGELTVSGGFAIETPVDTVVASPAIAGKQVDVNASGSFGVDAAITISGGYRVRLRRMEGNLELGVFRTNSREITVAATAQAGAAASVGKFDLAENFVKALSRQPAVDVDEFRRALPDEDANSRERQIEGFQHALEGAIATKIQASVQASFSKLRADEAAWLFEIDRAASSSPELQKALAAALVGNFKALTTDPKALPDGVAELANVLTHAEVKTQRLRVNLLGVLNFLSMAKVARTSTIERNERGEITLISDASNANRLKALILNGGIKADRLRRMLSENFLIEAAYQASKAGVLPPNFEARHTYLEIDDRTSPGDMKNNLDVAVALGLMSADEENRRLGNKNHFGRSTFYAEARYGADLSRKMFLNAANQPRSVAEYEELGREALRALLAGDKGQEFRLRVADSGPRGMALWKDMQRIGNVADFGPLFGRPLSEHPTDPRVAAASADFLVISSWAAKMNEAAKVIVEVDTMTGGAGVHADDAALTKAREHLKSRMSDVVKNSHDHFGDPLGLVMVYIAAGKAGERRVIVTAEDFRWDSNEAFRAGVGNRP